MAMNFRPVILLGFLLSLFLSASAQICGGQSFSNKVFGSCNDLPQLSSFLHWNYFPSNGSVSIAYRSPLSSPGWIVWGINPDGQKMVGTQAIVGVKYANGSSAAFTTQVDSLGPAMQPQPLKFAVSDVSQESGSADMTIYATLVLLDNVTTVNHVWQHGSVSGSTLNAHPMDTANRQSVGTLNFESGQGSSGGGNSKMRRRNVHGVLNAVSWGTLMPLGAIIARYMRVFKSADPAWFYLHVACQCSAYIIGVAGWGTGLKLGSDSPGITYDTHRNIGITMFVLGTLQVFALLLRPKKDHKYRLYWNIYHHSVGYTVIILSIINVFKGLDILDPEKKWKRTYIGIIIALGAVAVILEAITWPIVIKRKWRGSEKSHHGANGVNGYVSRQNQTV